MRKRPIRTTLQVVALSILLCSPFATWAALASQSVAACGGVMLATVCATAAALTAEAL